MKYDINRLQGGVAATAGEGDQLHGTMEADYR